MNGSCVDLRLAISIVALLISLVALMLPVLHRWRENRQRRVAHRNLAQITWEMARGALWKARKWECFDRNAYEIAATSYAIDAIDMKTVTPASWLIDIIEIRHVWSEAQGVVMAPEESSVERIDELLQKGENAMRKMDEQLERDGAKIKRISPTRSLAVMPWW